DPTDLDDAAPGDADIGDACVGPCSIDDGAATDDQFEFAHAATPSLASARPAFDQRSGSTSMLGPSPLRMTSTNSARPDAGSRWTRAIVPPARSSIGMSSTGAPASHVARGP